MCASCMSAKVNPGQNFMCHECVSDSDEPGLGYGFRAKIIDIVSEPAGVAGNDKTLVWGIFDHGSNCILYLTVEGKRILAYNRHIGNIVNCADKLYDANIYIGRAYVDKHIIENYLPVKIKVGGSTRKTITWQKFDLDENKTYGRIMERDFGNDGMGVIHEKK